MVRRVCNHSKYSDAHCASMVCWNYVSRCPRHAASGSKNERCSRANEDYPFNLQMDSFIGWVVDNLQGAEVEEAPNGDLIISTLLRRDPDEGDGPEGYLYHHEDDR